MARALPSLVFPLYDAAYCILPLLCTLYSLFTLVPLSPFPFYFVSLASLLVYRLLSLSPLYRLLSSRLSLLALRSGTAGSSSGVLLEDL